MRSPIEKYTLIYYSILLYRAGWPGTGPGHNLLCANVCRVAATAKGKRETPPNLLKPALRIARGLSGWDRRMEQNLRIWRPRANKTAVVVQWQNQKEVITTSMAPALPCEKVSSS